MSRLRTTFLLTAVPCLALGLFGFGGSYVAFAQEKIQEIQETIQETSTKLKALEEGIKKDEENLNRLADEKQTLSKALSTAPHFTIEGSPSKCCRSMQSLPLPSFNSVYMRRTAVR